MTVEPLEHFLVASPDVLPLGHDFCHPGPWKWRSTPRDVAIFSLSFFFFGSAKNLGICESTKDRSGVSSRNREKKEHLEEPSDWFSLHVALWCYWPSNAPLKDAELNWDATTENTKMNPRWLPVRSFCARPVACNSQWVISEPCDLFSAPSSFTYMPITFQNQWYLVKCALKLWVWKWCKFMLFYAIFCL